MPMPVFLRTRTRQFIAVLAIIGLVVGCVAGFLTSRQDRFLAQVTLAMLPGPEVPPEAALGFWEVLNNGQATRTAAMTLEDPRWLGAISQDTGFLTSDFALSAGAVPDTTLVVVTLEASSAWAAERGLTTIVTDGVADAEKVSGPFALETVSVDYTQASSLSPALLPTVIVSGLAGLLLGSGVGFLIGRSLEGRKAEGRKAGTGGSSTRIQNSAPRSTAGRKEAESRPSSAPKRMKRVP